MLVVVVGVAAGGELAQEARPGVLGLALEEHVAVRPALLRQQVGHRPAEDHGLAAARKRSAIVEDALHLDDVAGDADDLGVGVVVDALAGVLVAERDAELGRRQGGQGEQAQRREDGLIGGHRQEVLHPPEGGGEPGLDEGKRRVRLRREGRTTMDSRKKVTSTVLSRFGRVTPPLAVADPHSRSIARSARSCFPSAVVTPSRALGNGSARPEGRHTSPASVRPIAVRWVRVPEVACRLRPAIFQELCRAPPADLQLAGVHSAGATSADGPPAPRPRGGPPVASHGGPKGVAASACARSCWNGCAAGLEHAVDEEALGLV